MLFLVVFFVLPLHNSGVGCFSFVINGLTFGNSHRTSGDGWPAAFIGRREKERGMHFRPVQLRSFRSSSCRFNCEFCSDCASKWWIICTYLIGWRMVLRGFSGGKLRIEKCALVLHCRRRCWVVSRGQLSGWLPTSSTVSCRKIVLQLWLAIKDFDFWFKKKGALFPYVCEALILRITALISLLYESDQQIT